MTPDEYTELVDFLGRKFDRIDQPFDHMDRRFEQVDQRFERLEGEVAGVKGEVTGLTGQVTGLTGEVRELRVLVEKNTSDIRTVADGVQVANDRLERFQTEVHEEFANVRQEMKWGFDTVHERMERLEGDLDQVKTARRR